MKRNSCAHILRQPTVYAVAMVLTAICGCEGLALTQTENSSSTTSSADVADDSVGLGAPVPGYGSAGAWGADSAGALLPLGSSGEAAGHHTGRPGEEIATDWVDEPAPGATTPGDDGSDSVSDVIVTPDEVTTDGDGDSDIEPAIEPDVVDTDTSTDPDVEWVDPSSDHQSGTLTAGSFDDNLNLEAFEEFVAGILQYDASDQWPDMTLGDRVIITVLDETGEPVGNARVVVTTESSQQQASRTLLDMPTRSDGRALFSTLIDGAADAEAFTLTVYPPDGSTPVVVATDLTDPDWTVTLPGMTAALPDQLDLAFVVDATGSMTDELEFLKVEIDDIVTSVAESFPAVNQHYALIVYRDKGDIYVTRTFDFTASLSEFQANLSDQHAAGGNDYPEAMHLALEEAGALSWRSANTARVLFLIADAPPHDEYAQRTLDAVLGIRSQAVAIYPVAASGVAEGAEYMMRSAALLTLSEYCFLTDDSGVGYSHAEPHIPCYHVQRLDQLMIRMISSELAGRRLYPESEDVIRTVGNPVDGVCEADPAPNGQQ